MTAASENHTEAKAVILEVIRGIHIRMGEMIRKCHLLEN